ncbi:CidA/LrgA family protein [Soehngenia saccharolytica]|nr:CidA/LrgA family protein [Soehngenia saccharolytica]
MKKLKQLGILLLILWLANIISVNYINILPPTIIGMVILFLLLKLNILKISHIEDISSVLLEYLPFMFLPIGVGVINVLDVLKNDLIPILITVCLTLTLVMITTGKTIQFMINIKKERENK